MLLVALEAEERSLAEQRDLPAEGAAAVVRGDLRALIAASDRDRRETEDIGRRSGGDSRPSRLDRPGIGRVG